MGAGTDSGKPDAINRVATGVDGYHVLYVSGRKRRRELGNSLAQRSLASGVYLRPDFLWPERHIDGCDAERRERIQHRIHNRGWAANTPRLAHTFGPKRIPGRWRLDIGRDKRGELIGNRQGIIH